MEEKRKFVCSFCGAEYDTAPAMARCVLACDEKQRREAEQHRREELGREQEKRYKEIEEMNEKLNSLIEKYNKDYGDNILAPVTRDVLRRLFCW